VSLSQETPVDLAGVGIGPFNLGLAALASSVATLRTRFYDSSTRFDWHPGMMIEGASLQVPFLADLVTTVDPCSPLSFLSFLNRTGRLYQFAIRERYFVSRKEYNLYCRWVADQLPSLAFGTLVTGICYDHHARLYEIEGAEHHQPARLLCRARNVVLGTGTAPRLPPWLPTPLPANMFHSAAYLHHREDLLAQGAIAIVGSGQSAGEIFLDLLTRKTRHTRLHWFSRSERFFPMDYSKLTLEMSTPEYIDHFFRLPRERKASLLQGQDVLYKGMNEALIASIYDTLYERSLEGDPGDVRLAANCELEALRTGVEAEPLVLRFRHLELEEQFEHRTGALVLATGYEYRSPDCLAPLHADLLLDDEGRLVINRHYQVACTHGGLYAQNAELCSHGFNASDLSLGPYRNALILNTILGDERFAVDGRVAFQDFGVRPDERVGSTASTPLRDPAKRAPNSRRPRLLELPPEHEPVKAP
jgi:lysine N6-hydroxylase